jgi:hypothetical protein
MITLAEFENRLADECKEVKALENIITEIENKIGLCRHLKYKAKKLLDHSEMLELSDTEQELARRTVEILELTWNSLEAQHSMAMNFLRRHQKEEEELRAVGFLIKKGVEGLFDESVEFVSGHKKGE